MTTQQAILFFATVVAISSCAPHPSSQAAESDSLNPAAQAKKYKKVPTGHPDPQGRANMVVSPYRPYNIIDVTGYRSGDIVGDRSTAIVNPSTGRIELSTSKYFKVP